MLFCFLESCLNGRTVFPLSMTVGVPWYFAFFTPFFFVCFNIATECGFVRIFFGGSENAMRGSGGLELGIERDGCVCVVGEMVAGCER